MASALHDTEQIMKSLLILMHVTKAYTLCVVYKKGKGKVVMLLSAEP